MKKNILRDVRNMVCYDLWSILFIHDPWSAHWTKVQGHFWTRCMVGYSYDIGCQESWLFFFGICKSLIVLLFGIKYSIYWQKKVTEAWRQVRKVLHRLWKNGLYARVDKCKFHSDTVEYLGYILSSEELIMSSNKVHTIMNWPEPHWVKDIQSFLGFCNFYYHFIKNYSNIAFLLMHLKCKSTPWNFLELCKQIFAALKEAFMSILVLKYWVPDAQIVVKTNASDYVLVTILSIYSIDFDIHLITFHFYIFSAPELNYDVYNIEPLLTSASSDRYCHWPQEPYLLFYY